MIAAKQLPSPVENIAIIAFDNPIDAPFNSSVKYAQQ